MQFYINNIALQISSFSHINFLLKYYDPIKLFFADFSIHTFLLITWQNVIRNFHTKDLRGSISKSPHRILLNYFVSQRY